MTLEAFQTFDFGSELKNQQAQVCIAYCIYINISHKTAYFLGSILFVGSENTNILGEYIAIELEQSRPKLSINFGNKEPITLLLSPKVNDCNWRELILSRVGKRATFKLTIPNSDEQFADEQTLIMPGAKSILKLFADRKRLFIGAAPPDFKVTNSKLYSSAT